MHNPPIKVVDPTLLREAMARRLYRRSAVSGQISLPAVPEMVDEYVSMCDTVFAGVGREFTPDELADLEAALQDQVAKAYAASPRSNVIIKFTASVGPILNYVVTHEWLTVDAAHEQWIDSHEPRMFGTRPDARVWALANNIIDPRAHPVLEIGARTGRNSLALARRGHPVDAIVSTPRFADMLRSNANRELLDLHVIERDDFLNADGLRHDYQLILLSEVVSDFRTTRRLRDMFELAARCLAPGRSLVFNAFLADQGYVPDDAARQLGQQSLTSIFTRYELAAAVAGLPLELVADDSVYEYEMAHLPPGAWPPTVWYPDWVSGLEVFDVERGLSPVEMRWLVYEKTH